MHCSMVDLAIDPIRATTDLATRREAPRSTEGERRDDSRAC
jgi:hypothetical protein